MTAFEDSYEPEPTSGCWLWTRSTAGQMGYGRFNMPDRREYAHRYSYELHIGPIPTGLQVLHRCDTPLCVNPAHLWLGTIADNAHDRDRKGRHRTNGNERKTHCPQGHAYDEANTYLSKRNLRSCRACARARHHARRQRLKATA